MAMREIHRLITSEGLSNNQLCQRLNLPRRTLERYLHELFAEDSLILIRPTVQEVATQAAIFREQLMQQRQQVLLMANDTSVDPSARISAFNLAAELAWASLKLIIMPPAALERSLRRLEGGSDSNKSTLIGLATAAATTIDVKHVLIEGKGQEE